MPFLSVKTDNAFSSLWKKKIGIPVLFLQRGKKFHKRANTQEQSGWILFDFTLTKV